MAREDGVAAPVALAAVVTAALFSPRLRGLLRKGAVHGLAGALVAGDALVAFARGVNDGVQDAAAARNPGQPTEGVRAEPGPYAPSVGSENAVPEAVSESAAGPSAGAKRTRRRTSRKKAATTATRHPTSSVNSLTESSNA